MEVCVYVYGYVYVNGLRLRGSEFLAVFSPEKNINEFVDSRFRNSRQFALNGLLNFENPDKKHHVMMIC